MKNKKSIFIILMMPFIIVFFILAGCEGGGNTNNDDPNAELKVWASQSDKAMITTMVNQFLAANTDITNNITVTTQEDNQAQTQFLKDPSAAADVVCLPHNSIGALVAGDNLYPVVGDSNLQAINLNTAASVEAAKYNGKLYGFPASVETPFLFYDTRVFNADDVKTFEGIIQKSTGTQYNFGMDFGDSYYSSLWFFTYGCTLSGQINEGKSSISIDFNNASGKAAAEKITSLGSQKVTMCNRGAASTLFDGGKLGSFIGGPWDVVDFSSRLGSNLGMAELPTIEGKQMKAFSGYKVYSVNSRTKNRSVSMRLAAWLASGENQRTRFTTRNFLPVNSELLMDTAITSSPAATKCLAQLANSIQMPSVPEMVNFWEPVGAVTENCFKGKISSSNIQTKLDEMVGYVKNGGFILA